MTLPIPRLPDPPEGFIWPRCPEADAFIRAPIDAFLLRHEFARTLKAEMLEAISTLFFDWVDHVRLPRNDVDAKTWTELGFRPDPRSTAERDMEPWWHPHAHLPTVVFDDLSNSPGVAIHVESLLDFQTAHGLSEPIEGAAYSAYRQIRMTEGDATLFVVERRGSRTYRPVSPGLADRALHHLEAWTLRPRRFLDDDQGMAHALDKARGMVAELGPAAAACIFLEGERRYWQARNHAGRLQKWRQDRLGLGWANHDHHTFRSSRRHFPALIQIFETFGFARRERFYAGTDAGWGAQVMEQPDAGLVIFADVDLAPSDASVDFSTQPLEPLGSLGTVGLWCGLHGESILQAGMHHLEAQFDFDFLRDSLQTLGVETMKPFSDFDHLRQAFTVAERWPVERRRLDDLLSRSMISREAYDTILDQGAVGSHLENLQRREGFKGFNQHGVSRILHEVHPERQALQSPQT